MNQTKNNKLPRFVAAATMSLVLLMGAAASQAQGIKPVLVVSLPSITELQANVNFLAELAGQQGASMMVNAMIQGYTKGVDQTKPLGLEISIAEDGGFAPAVFIPVTNVKDLTTTLTNAHVIGPVQDDGGVMKVTSPTGMDLYVREQSGWAYVTQNKDTALPSDDPIKLMAGINPDYDLGIRIMLQNVPEEVKKAALEKFRGFMQIAAAAQQQQGGGENPFSTLSEKNLEQQVAAIERLMKEANQVTIGWKIDRAAKNTYLDFSVTAVPGSQLDTEMKQMATGTTNFAGFIQPDAAVDLCFTGKNSQENIDQTLTYLDSIKQKANDAIDKDNDLPDDKKPGVKQVLSEFMGVAENTVKAGKSDGGFVMQMGPGKFQAVAGGFVASGPALEQAISDLVTIGKGEPQFEEHATVKMDLETYKGIHFDQLSIKLPEEAGEEAKKIFGDSVDIYFGTGPTSAFFAVGKGSLDAVKSVIDRSQAEPNKSIPPMQMSVALTPIADFVGSVDQDSAQPAAAFSQALGQTPGKDHLTINAKSIPNGMSYRFTVEEGVLKACGAMAAHSGPGGGPGN